MHLTPLPAFNDNYLWLWHNNSHAVVVDPGDGEVVMQALAVAIGVVAAVVILAGVAGTIKPART